MDISLSLRTLRRTIAGLSLLAVLATMSVAGIAKAQTFSDVESDSWYYEYVEELVSQGAVAGYDDGTFGPADYLTRAQAAKIMVLAYAGEDEVDYDYDAGFTDVDADAWYAAYVNTAAKLGIVSGYTTEDGDSTGEFGPDDYINRAGFAKMVVSAAGLESDLTDAPHFSDVDDGSWYYDFVETAYNNSVVDGYSDGTYKPANNVNRAEACKLVVLGETPTLRYTEDEECDEGYEWDSDTEACVEVVVEEECDEGYEWDSDTEACVEVVEDVSTGTLTVAMGDEIDGATLPKGATSVDMLNVAFTADGDDVELDGFTMHRTGVGSSSDFSSVYVYEGDNRLTTAKTIASDTNEATFGSLNLTVADGETVTLTLVVDMSTTAVTGDESALEIVSVDAIDSDAVEATGTFPITGNTFEMSGASAGTMTIAVHGATANPTLGDTDAEISEFQLTAASEDMAFARVALTVKGTVQGSALSNFKLWQGSDVIATADTISDDELVTFVVNGTYNCTSYDEPGYCVSKGNSKTFNVTADIGAEADPTDTIIVYLEESTDLEAIGLVYGYGAQVSYGDFDNVTSGGTDDSQCTIQGGQFTVSQDGPASTDVTINGKDVVLTKMTFTSERNIDIRKLSVILISDTGSGLISDDNAVANFSDVKLVELDDDGVYVDTLMGPGDLVLTGNDTEAAGQTLTFTDSWEMAVGESINVAITCDIANYTSLEGTTIEGQLAVVASDGIYDNDAGEYVTDIVPSSSPAIDGYDMTVRAASLSVALASDPDSDTFVKGTENVALAAFALSSGSAMDVEVTEINVTGYLDADLDTTYNDIATTV
ncbi:MAG: S-layer homology domain-containing protein, partial [Candidatus Gracilibacteria bacterium]